MERQLASAKNVMGEVRTTRIVTIRSANGLHARPAEQLARLAGQFKAEIICIKDGDRIDAKSVLNILTMAAEQGTQLVLEAVGPDADEAIAALARLVESDFNDDPYDSLPSPS